MAKIFLILIFIPLICAAPRSCRLKWDRCMDSDPSLSPRDHPTSTECDNYIAKRHKECRAYEEPYEEVDAKTKSVKDNYRSSYKKTNEPLVSKRDKTRKEKEKIYVKEDLVELEDVKRTTEPSKESYKKAQAVAMAKEEGDKARAEANAARVSSIKSLVGLF